MLPTGAPIVSTRNEVVDITVDGAVDKAVDSPPSRSVSCGQKTIALLGGGVRRLDPHQKPPCLFHVKQAKNHKRAPPIRGSSPIPADNRTSYSRRSSGKATWDVNLSRQRSCLASV